MSYEEDDFLLLSGIQHFVFCRRQWALIHIEQQWQENLRTIEGKLMHERSHNPEADETRKGVRTTRGLPVHSRELGISGVCDVVEFHPGKTIPVEHKRGSPKEGDADILQLVLQALCLEEMTGASVETGYLFYGETKRRLEVSITQELRLQAAEITGEMHRCFDRGHTPKVKTGKHCTACSLRDLCLPKLCKTPSAKGYIQESIEEILHEKVT